MPDGAVVKLIGKISLMLTDKYLSCSCQSVAAAGRVDMKNIGQPAGDQPAAVALQDVILTNVLLNITAL